MNNQRRAAPPNPPLSADEVAEDAFTTDGGRPAHVPKDSAKLIPKDSRRKREKKSKACHV